MKPLMTSILILLSLNTFSYEISPLCQTLSGEGLVTLADKQIKAGIEFSEFEKLAVLRMVKEVYIYGLENTQTFEEIVAHFEENQFDEAHVMTQKNELTGEIFTYAWSYPGDNEYGVWFNSAGETIALVQDSDLVIGNQFCPW